MQSLSDSNTYQVNMTSVSPVDPKLSNPKVTGVIVSVREGGSYDKALTEYEQISRDGKVNVHVVTSNYIEELLSLFLGKDRTTDDSMILQRSKSIYDDIQNVPSNKVIFNWECCAGWCFHHGSEVMTEFKHKELTVYLMGFILSKGYMIMCADFALKALISCWEPNVFGPCPFRNIGECTGPLKLSFDTEVLKSCDSSQLRYLGNLSEKGEAVIQTMGSTIVYAVDSGVTTDRYELKVLTVASDFHNCQKFQSYVRTALNTEQKGTAGHVILKYPSGGILLTSNGHFCELKKVNTNAQRLQEVSSGIGEKYSQYVKQRLSQARELGGTMMEEAESNVLASEMINRVTSY